MVTKCERSVQFYSKISGGWPVFRKLPLLEELKKLAKCFWATTIESRYIRIFSLGFDERCDMSDTVQLLVFIRAVAKDLSVHEDFVVLISLHDTTRGVDIKEAVLNALHNKIPNLSLS